LSQRTPNWQRKPPFAVSSSDWLAANWFVPQIKDKTLLPPHPALGTAVSSLSPLNTACWKTSSTISRKTISVIGRLQEPRGADLVSHRPRRGCDRPEGDSAKRSAAARRYLGETKEI
jgi:hypothetical protein